MTATASELIERAFVEIFRQRDAEARRRAIDELFAADIAFRDPEGETHGVPNIASKIDALIAGMDPSWSFRSVTPPVQLGDLAIHRWELGPDGAAIVTGTDVVFVADGKIAKFHTLVN
ncbi:MAG: nuclear transport factor 2 family protein [Pseudolysinimonas sp.]